MENPMKIHKTVTSDLNVHVHFLSGLLPVVTFKSQPPPLPPPPPPSKKDNKIDICKISKNVLSKLYHMENAKT